MKIQENVSLAGQTSFRVGGAARYFFDARDKDDLVRAVFFAKEKGLPFFILGGGSNLLVSDEGFDGLIIKTQSSKLKVQNCKSKLKTIQAEAGARLGDLVRFSVENNLTGLEWAAGIPGTIGGAIRGNASAFGFNISGCVEQVQVLDKNLQVKKYSPFGFSKAELGECRFGYRESVFKENGEIILSVDVGLKKRNKEKIRAAVQDFLIRKKEEQPLDKFSAGCIFKNPSGQFAGKMIDDCGLKGERIGEAEISKKHANFIINLGGARAKDIAALIALAKTEVKKKFGVDIKEEIERVGF